MISFSLWLGRIRSFGELSMVFGKEFFLSSLNVMKLCIVPPTSFQSEIIELRLQTQNEYVRILIAHIISLTPGSFSIDISQADPHSILVHLLDQKKKAEFLKWIETEVEPLAEKILGKWETSE